MSLCAHAVVQTQHTSQLLPLPVDAPSGAARWPAGFKGGLARRVVACLDVRANDAGDLVVTKGDQYDVREKEDARGVRNLGKPVELCKQYYEGGADEVAFLNITGFRDFPLEDLPMLEVRLRLQVATRASAGLRGV